MGYSTRFSGYFNLDPQPTAEQVAEVNKFNSERHDPGVTRDEYNVHGEVVPGLGISSVWCQWKIVAPGEDVDGSEGILNLENDQFVLAWDQNEKFYEYIPWLRFLVSRFFGPWGISLVGNVEWEDDYEDCGKIPCEKIAEQPLTRVRAFEGEKSISYREIS